MPMYEYKCKCGHVFSIIQRMGAGADGLECPECKGKDLVKLLSRTFSPDSTKAMPASLESAGAKMPSGMGGCGSGMCGSGMCGV